MQRTPAAVIIGVFLLLLGACGTSARESTPEQPVTTGTTADFSDEATPTSTTLGSESRVATTDPNINTTMAPSAAPATTRPVATAVAAVRWPGSLDPQPSPSRFLVRYGDHLELWDTIADQSAVARTIPVVDPAAAFLAGNDIIFSSHGEPGLLISPRPAGYEGPPVADGKAGILLSPSAGGALVLDDVLAIGGDHLVVYREVDTGAAFDEGDERVVPQRVMVHDLSTGENRTVIDVLNRDPSLPAGVRRAGLRHVSAGGGLLALTFNLGDSAWFEFYDMNGQPTTWPAPLPSWQEAAAVSNGTLAVDGSLFAYSREHPDQQTHRNLVIADPRLGEALTFPIGRDGMWIAGLDAFDRWVTGTLKAGGDTSIDGVFIVDLVSGQRVVLDSPFAITGDRTAPAFWCGIHDCLGVDDERRTVVELELESWLRGTESDVPSGRFALVSAVVADGSDLFAVTSFATRFEPGVFGYVEGEWSLGWGGIADHRADIVHHLMLAYPDVPISMLRALDLEGFVD